MTLTTVPPLEVEVGDSVLRNGRYWLPNPAAPTGKPKGHTRVSNIAKLLDDTTFLDKWKQRNLAHGIGQRADLYALAAATPLDNKQEMDELCDAAITASGGDRGRNIGTALHSATERIDLGEPDVTMPEPWDADLDAYRQATASLTFHRGWIERMLYHPDLAIAGTCDRLVSLPESEYPQPMIGDLKSGKTLQWLPVAVQLALYARAPYWFDEETDTYGETAGWNVDLERALIIHLPEGQARCELWLVDIAAGWEAVQLALEVRDMRKRSSKFATPYTPGATT